MSKLISLVVTAVVSYFAGPVAGAAAGNYAGQMSQLMLNGQYDWGRALRLGLNPFGGNKEDLARSIYDPGSHGAPGRIDYKSIGVSAAAAAVTAGVSQYASYLGMGTYASLAVQTTASYAANYQLSKWAGYDVSWSNRQLGANLGAAFASQAVLGGNTPKDKHEANVGLQGADQSQGQIPGMQGVGQAFDWKAAAMQTTRKFSQSVINSGIQYGMERLFGVEDASWDWGSVATSALGNAAGTFIRAGFDHRQAGQVVKTSKKNKVDGDKPPKSQGYLSEPIKIADGYDGPIYLTPDGVVVNGATGERGSSMSREQFDHYLAEHDKDLPAYDNMPTERRTHTREQARKFSDDWLNIVLGLPGKDESAAPESLENVQAPKPSLWSGDDSFWSDVPWLGGAQLKDDSWRMRGVASQPPQERVDVDIWLPNSAGQGAVSMWDTSQRMKYKKAIEAASKAAIADISIARAANNVDDAIDAAERASLARIEARNATRTRISWGAQVFSKVVDKSHPPAYYFKAEMLKAEKINMFDIAETVATKAGSSRGSLDGLIKLGKWGGPIATAIGTGVAVNEVVKAPEGTKVKVATEQGLGVLGGALGASVGTAVAVGGAVMLGLTPVGWGIIAVGLVGGAVGGYLGTEGGQWLGDNVYTWSSKGFGWSETP